MDNTLRPTARRLNLRVEILKLKSTKTRVGTSAGQYDTYATRWAGRIDGSGIDRIAHSQPVATSDDTFIFKRDDNVVPGWALRYPASTGATYFINQVHDPEDGDRRYMIVIAEKREGITVA